MASSDASAPKPPKRPFWMHQVAEYLLGAVLIAQGLQSPTPAMPAIAGGLIVINAAIVRGPLSAFNLVSRATHRVLDLAVIVAVVVLAVQPWISVESSARVTMVVIAAVMGFIWWQSSFAEKPKKKAAKAGSAQGAPSATPEGRSTEIGRLAGRAAASGVLAARRVKNNRKT